MSNQQDVIDRLVGDCEQPESVQLAFVEPFGDLLANNSHLSTAAWCALYDNGRAKLDRAGALLRRPLTIDMLATAVAHETRDRLLAEALRGSDFTAEQLELMLETRRRPIGPRTAVEVLRRLPGHSCHRELRGGDRLWFWILRPGVSAEERLQQVTATVQTGSDKAWRNQLRQVWQAGTALDAELCALVVSGAGGSDALVAAAGSPQLVGENLQREMFDRVRDTHWGLLALIANPLLCRSVTNDMVEYAGSTRNFELLRAGEARLQRPVVSSFVTAGSETCGEMLLRRVFPTNYNRGRPWHGVLLYSNPHLDEVQRTRLGRYLAECEFHPFVEGVIPDTVRVLRNENEATLVRVETWTPTRDLLDRSAADYYGDASLLAEQLAEMLDDVPAQWLFLCRMAPEFSGSWRDLVAVTKALA